MEGDEKRVRQLQQQLSSIGATEQKALEREKRKLSKRLGELDKLFSALYEDKVMERITERNFDMGLVIALQAARMALPAAFLSV